MSLCTRCLEREATPIGDLCRSCRYYTRSEPKLAADDLRHGTRNGYINVGCRCGPCTLANSQAIFEWRRRTGRTKPRLARGRTHGIRSTYTKGCRCDECRRAEADYRRDYRKRSAS